MAPQVALVRPIERLMKEFPKLKARHRSPPADPQIETPRLSCRRISVNAQGKQKKFPRLFSKAISLIVRSSRTTTFEGNNCLALYLHARQLYQVAEIYRSLIRISLSQNSICGSRPRSSSPFRQAVEADPPITALIRMVNPITIQSNNSTVG
jgi:hypothetical protein